MLSAFIEHRHYNADTASLSAYSTDNALKILEMIVRAHRNRLTVHLVGNAVVKHVANNVNVISSQRLMNGALCFTAAETGARRIDKEGAFGIVATPLLQVGIDLCCKVLTSTHSNYAQIAK